MEAVASTAAYGFRFQPSDESLVLNFLLPRNLGNDDVTESSPIIADDPYRMEPWKLLAAHRIDAEEGAYFLTKKVMVSSNGVRRKRTVGDVEKIIGTWRIQHSDNRSNVDRVPANKIVGWRKTLLSYYKADDGSSTTGYVMYEYELFKNDHTGGGSSEGRRRGETHDYVICRVSLSCREISRRNRQRMESAAASRSSTGPVTSSSASASSFGSVRTDSTDSYPQSSAFSPSLFEPRTLLVPNPHFAFLPALPSSPGLGTLPQLATYEEASFLPAGTASVLYSAPSFESAREETPSTGIASANLNPSSSAISYSSMLQFGNNHAEYYLYPNSCIEPPLPSYALPPQSYMLPQPPFAAATTVPFETEPQQQPPPALPAAAVQGIAEPPLDCNGEADTEMTIDEIFAALDEGALKEEPQMQQLPLYAFTDDYSNFSNFYNDNGPNDVFSGS